MPINLNTPEERLKKLQEKGMGTGTAAQNLSTTATPSPSLPLNATLTPSDTPSVTQVKPVEPIKTVVQSPVPQKQSFNEATQGQDVQFRQMYRDSLAQKLDTPVTSNITTPTTTPVTGIKPEYISQADWNKIQTEGTKNIKDTYSSYNIAKSQYEQNKNYYTNFDEKNNQYSNVLNSLQTAQSQNQNAPLTDAQYQNIASQYGLTIDQVKNPLNIFSQGLVMTDEGKRKLGTATAEQNITDATTQYDRTKSDLAIKAQQTQDQFQQQIDDVQKQLTRNIDWMNAQGAWSGSNKSSGYVQGIKNVKTDGETTINRLKTLAEQARMADATSVSRLTEDFSTGIARAKTALDDQMKEVNQSAGLQLAGLTEQYGLGNKTLTTQLDKIMQDMDSKTADAQSKYIANLKAIQGITSTNIEQYAKLQELNDNIANKRTDELLKNNGAILQNTSLTTLAQSVKDGSISPQKYADLKSYMLSGIQTALGKLGTLTTADTHTIEHLLETGSTPAQVIAKLQETGRFVSDSGTKLQTITSTDADGNEIKQTGYMDANNVWHPVNATASSTGSTSGLQDMTNTLIRPKGSVNVGQDTNNPGNIMVLSGVNPPQGAVGTYRSPNGRNYYVFPDMNTGLQAARNDIEAKLSGKSSWVTPDMTLGQLASGWTSGPNAPFNTGASQNYSRISGFSADTPISQIPKDKLIDAIVGNEGVDTTKSAIVPVTEQQITPTTSTEFTNLQRDIIGAFDGKDVKKLAQNLGVNVKTARDMYDSFKADNKLSDQDTGILSSYLKDISGTAVSAPEYARQEKRFISMRNSGMSTQEIMNQLGGYVPTIENKDNQSVKNQLEELQPYASSLGADASKTIGTLINQGNFKKAVQEIENITYKQKGVDAKSISEAGSLIKKGNDLKDKIKLYEEKFGPINQWSTKATIMFQDDPGVQGLMADMANFVAKYRNEIAGSAITTGEASFLEPLIADIKNNPKNAMSKVDSIQRSLVNELNTTRDQVGLPQLNDWTSFYDIDTRSNAYKGTQKQENQSIPTDLEDRIRARLKK